MTETHTTADIHQEKEFEAQIVSCLICKSVTPDRRFEAIQEEMGA